MSAEFASLQLTLVERSVALGLGTHADGVQQLTNFQRRLGLGIPTDPPSDPAWIHVLDRIETCRSHDERVEAVMTEFEQLPPAVPQHIQQAWPTVGAFSIEVAGSTARTHFYSMDTDEESPLHATKLEMRQRELLTVLSGVYADHPELTHVAGGSWLYATSAYSALFPDIHVRNARVRRDRHTFRGMSHWGQFLDHRWSVRTDLADEFRQRVSAWDGGDPCPLFPINTLEVKSPIEAFDLRP